MDEWYFYFLYWYYPFMVVVAAFGIFVARKRHWIWGIVFLSILAFSATTEYHEMRELEKIYIETLMDGVIDPGETEDHDIRDDIWIGEEIGYTQTDVHEI